MTEGFVADCQAGFAFDLFSHSWNAVVVLARARARAGRGSCAR